MHTSLIDAITLNRQNVEIYTQAYHPCRLLPPHRIEDDAFQTPHKLCVPSGSVRFPPEACVLLKQRASATFLVCNGIKQGGILSPKLFNIYMDVLSQQLNKVMVGCCINGKVINHLYYADDLVLLSPSTHGMQKLLNECET